MDKCSRMLWLSLGILLAGCNSLTGNKLNISEEFPKNLVLSNIKILTNQLSDKEKDNDDLFSCMAPLLKGTGLIENTNPLVPALFKNLGNISSENALLGFSDDIFQPKSIFNFYEGKGIKDIVDHREIKEILKKLVKQGDKFPELLLVEYLLNFDLIKVLKEMNVKIDKNDPKIEYLARILELYFDAYFRSATGNLKITSTNTLDSKKEALDSSKNAGFIARDGSKYSFSGQSKTGEKLSIDHNQIGADIIRIFLEGVRDTYHPLPVSPDSTLAQNKEKLKEEFKEIQFDIFGKEDLKWHVGNKSYFYENKVDENKFNEIETDGKKSEATTATAVGKAIRGGFVGSLNNEALAKTLETAAGVISRQTTERYKWCSAVTQVNPI